MSENERISRLEEAVGRIDAAIERIGAALDALVRLEERHEETREALGRAFGLIEKQDERVTKLEIEMPMLRQVRTWVFGAVGFVCLAVGGAVVALAVK